MSGIQIYALVMLVLLALLWGVFIPMKRRADRRWKEYHDRRIAMLLALSRGEDFTWPPKEEQ